MPAHLNPGGCIDHSRRGLDLSNATEFASWLAKNGCPKELATRMMNGEFRTATQRHAERLQEQVERHRAPVPTTMTSAEIRAELVSELSAIDMRFEQAEDQLLRIRCEQIGRELRADAEEEPDEDDDFSFDQCAKCGSSDLDINYNSDSDMLESRCMRCNFRASRPALTDADVSAARDAHEKRMRMRGARGW